MRSVPDAEVGKSKINEIEAELPKFAVFRTICPHAMQGFWPDAKQLASLSESIHDRILKRMHAEFVGKIIGVNKAVLLFCSTKDNSPTVHPAHQYIESLSLLLR